MAKFFVGQRIKNRLSHPLVTGRVYGFSGAEPPCDLEIILDVATPNQEGRFFRKGEVCDGFQKDWDPITEAENPCDAEFKESLDKLLDGLPA